MDIKRIPFVICLVSWLGCSNGSAKFHQDRTDASGQLQIANTALFVAKAAKNLRLAAEGRLVAFTLDEPYPAELFRLQLDNNYIPPRGWKKEDELHLFPGTRTSDHPGGWARFVRGGDLIYQWATNWVDEKGNLVSYVIKYKFPEDAMPRGGVAEVEGVYYTAEQLKKFKGGHQNLDDASW